MLRDCQPPSSSKKSRHQRSSLRKAATAAEEAAPPPPVSLYVSIGDRLRDISCEIAQISYLMPDSAQGWNVVSSLQNLLSEAQAIVKDNTSSYIEATQLTNLQSSSAAQQDTDRPAKSAFKIHVHQESNTLTAVKDGSHTELQAPAGTLLHSIDEMVPPNKIQRTEIIPIRSMGLDNIAQAVDQITRSQQGLLSAPADQQSIHSNYVNAANSSLFTHNLMSQQSDPMRQTSILNPANNHSASSVVSGAHSLINMSNPSNMSLQMTSILPESYQLSASNVTSVTGVHGVTAGSMYGHLPTQPHPNRRYLEIQPSDNNQQQVFILSTK